jgi:hypothetical protein
MRPQDSKRRALRFVVEIGKGIAYVAFAAVAFAFVRSGLSADDGSATTPSAQLMSFPGGLVLVALIGIGVLGVGIYFIQKGVRRTFKADIALPSGRAGKGVVVLGVWGYVSKGIALAIVGVLIFGAALTTDPSAATGLDATLRSLLTLPFGQAIVGVVGGGFIAYGVYSLVRAKYARL